MKKAFTLVELTLVLAVMLVIASIGFFSLNSYQEWTKGTDASQKLKQVYIAQRLYLADNPNMPVEDITQETLLSYLQNSPQTFPTVESLGGNSLHINVAVTPPVIDDGSGHIYDPSSNPRDGLWDVGIY